MYGEDYHQREAEASAAASAASVAKSAAAEEKKRKRETERLQQQQQYDETDWDTVLSGKPTVATLRLYLTCNGLKAAGPKKDVMLQQVVNHIAAHRV